MKKRKRVYGAMLLTALLVMQVPVSEADASSSASDFQMELKTDNMRYGAGSAAAVRMKDSLSAGTEDTEETEKKKTAKTGTGGSGSENSAGDGGTGESGSGDAAGDSGTGESGSGDAAGTGGTGESGTGDAAGDGGTGESGSENSAGTGGTGESGPENSAGDGGSGENGSGDSAENRGAEGKVLGSSQVVGNRAVVFFEGGQGAANVSGVSGTAGGGTLGAGLNDIDQGENFLPAPGEGGVLPKYAVVDRTVIADGAYYRNQELTAVNFPSELKEVGRFSFARTGLTQVSLPQGTETVCYGAFYHCDKLGQVTLPETISCVEPNAFAHTAWVEEFMRGGKGDYLISGGVLAAYRGKGPDVAVPEGVRVIAGGAFAGNGGIKTVSLPDSLEVIGEGSFEGCENLEEVTGGSHVKRILDRAFKGCPITGIRIPGEVQSIGLGAYAVSDDAVDTGVRTAVFEGLQLPGTGCEYGSAVLDREELRVPALQGVLFAVVDPRLKQEQIRDALLDPGMIFFSGIVGSLGDDGRLQCRFTNLTAEELGRLQLPEGVYLDGVWHEVAGVEEIVFLPEEKTEPEPGTVLVTGLEGASATFQGLGEGYELRIEEAENAEALEAAYRRTAYSSLPVGCRVYDMTLKEGGTGVAISDLNGQRLMITLPVPAALQHLELRVITADRNGQLEQIPCTVEDTSEGRRLIFAAEHFSLYGIYGVGGTFAEAEVVDGRAVVTGFELSE